MLRPVIFRLALRYISRRFLQSVLFIIGVALGVAVIIAIDIANSSASRAFDLSAQSISGRATHQISAGESGLPTELYTQIRLDLGIKQSAPVITEFVRVEGVTQPLRLLGVDPLAEHPFRNYLSTIEVIGEDNINNFEAVTRFISEPGTMLISQSLADELSIQPGASLNVNVGGEPRAIRVIGLLRPQDRLSQQALANLLLTDIATAQEISALEGRISRIDLILDTTTELDAIRAVLPVNATLTSVQESSGALAQMTEAFEINLQALSLLAVVVGVFLIYNTVTFSVVQRRPVIGILRSLGATKDQIFAFIIGEALILGVIGTVLGMGLGIIFGRFTVGIVSQTINDLYFSVTVNTVAVPPLSLLKGVFLGVVASTGAAVVPSIDATRTAPIGSMKRSSLEEKTIELLPYITGAAVGFLLLGYLLLQIPTTSLIISFGALFCVIFGGALFTPLVLLLSMRAVTPLTNRLFGVLGRMAPRAIIRSLSRTSVAVAALTIAVSVIIGVSVMIGSFRNTVADWLENSLAADIYIAPPGLTANQSGADIDPVLRELVASVEGVERVAANRTRQVTAPDYSDMPPVNLEAVDFDLAGEGRDYVWLNAESASAALQSGSIMVSEPFAFRRGIMPDNHTLTLLTDAGEETFDIVGVFYDYSTEQGSVLMSRATYDQFWNDPYVTALAAFIAPDESVDLVIERIQAQLVDYDVIVQSNRSLKDNVFEVFERTFTITVALRLLATLVAFIGILSALMALQLEHTREYGVMRATGMTPAQLRLYTFIQTGLMGIVAGVLAIPIGLVLAMVLVYVINVRSFGWTMQFEIIYGEIAQAFAVAIGAALLAGIYPALQLAKMNISRAIRSE